MRVVKSAEERKNEILDVAEQLFAERGFDNASTNDIIHRIGIARGTLYHHFGSKEEILDAIVERMTGESIRRARAITSDHSIPLLERLSAMIISLDINSGAGVEVLEQIHRPQNALLHQKMQERLMDGVLPLLTSLIEEGNVSGMFDSMYPYEAAEMIMAYANTAFDIHVGTDPDFIERKKIAFICHTERILGAEKGCLEQTIMSIFSRQADV